MATTSKNSPPTKAVTTTPSDREIRMVRTLNADRTRVWEAFTDPKLVSQWWGRGNKLTVERLEPKKGGHWRFVEHADGEKHGFEGRFAEVVEPERIVQTFEWDGMPGHPLLQTATFEDLGDGKTRVVTNATFYTKEERDGMLNSGMETGANESYDALERLLMRQR
jgi:uncharacterized protein YndB with AHSA1/START domain